MPDFAKIASTFYSLLRKQAPWNGQKRNKTLLIVLRLLCAYSILLHYDPTAELVLQCDASGEQLGAACNLDQKVHYNQDTKHAVQNKITLRLSASPCPLLGRHFKLLTDHKPLIILFGEHNCLCPSRQRRESKDGHYF